MKALSLFSGIGGLDIAAEAVGIHPVAFCEIEPFPVSILQKRFPDVPIIHDVKEIKGEDYSGKIDIIFGGFPCQDLSVAGKQVGLEGARSGLWFEMLRVIREARPNFVLAENVRGAVNKALDTVKSGLEDEGYEIWPFVVPAAAFGAPHKRERLFVIGIKREIADICRFNMQRFCEEQYDAEQYGRYGGESSIMENSGCRLLLRIEFSKENGNENREENADMHQRPGGLLWPSPVASDGAAGGIISSNDIYTVNESGACRKINKNGVNGSIGLARLVKLINPEEKSFFAKDSLKLWATPIKEDYRRREPVSRQKGLPEQVYERSDNTAQEDIKLWATPTINGNYNVKEMSKNSGDGLITQVNNTSAVPKLWATPREFMYKDAVYDRGKSNLGEQVAGQDNEINMHELSQSSNSKAEAQQKNGGTKGQLNPDWVEQLMGYPEGWTNPNVETPSEWKGWPALMGERFWGTPNCMDVLPSRSFEAMKMQATSGGRKNRTAPGNLREQIDPEMRRAYMEVSTKHKEIVVTYQHPYEFPRTIKGAKHRKERLKALGNSVVPQQVFPFFKAISILNDISKKKSSVSEPQSDTLL